MKITFKMSFYDYYEGWKHKSKITNNRNLLYLLFVLFCACVILVMNFTAISPFILILPASFAVALIAIDLIQRKTLEAIFQRSRVLNCEHTVRLYDEGIEVFNGYEKIYSPWQSICSVKETANHLIILPSLRLGIIAINKKRYASEELDRIAATLKEKMRNERGSK